MFKNMRTTIVGLLSAALLVVPMMTPALALAATGTNGIENNLCSGATDLTVNGSSDCNSTGGSADNLNTLITDGVNIFSVIVGVVAVIMIIVGGFRYITSGGDSSSVSSAKTTIIYAIVGLIIVALAQFIVQFVLNKVTGSTSN